MPSPSFSDINRDFGINGKPLIITDIDDINLSIDNILSTKPGERMMLPEFGSALGALLFEPINNTNSQKLLDATVLAISRWEPRVILNYQASRFVAVPNEHLYQMTLFYTIISSGQSVNYSRPVIAP